MTNGQGDSPNGTKPRIVSGVTRVGQWAEQLLASAGGLVRFIGGLSYLLSDTAAWAFRGIFVRQVKFGREQLFYQMVRVGVRSIPIIVLVLTFVGIILALQMAPTLEDYGQIESTATIVAIAIVRELGPLLAAIVLSGFAGASIAAEIGAMVEAEEIKALRAHALNPIRFLVVPRVLATAVMLTGLAIIADVVGVCGGLLAGWGILDIPAQTYMNTTWDALKMTDFITGLIKAGVFGMLISLIACYEGLNVSGGAEGVGRATTATVVKSIVALIGTDMVFTAVFYVYEL